VLGKYLCTNLSTWYQVGPTVAWFHKRVQPEEFSERRILSHKSFELAGYVRYTTTRKGLYEVLREYSYVQDLNGKDKDRYVGVLRCQ
jgi:hypothetical protein